MDLPTCMSLGCICYPCLHCCNLPRRFEGTRTCAFTYWPGWFAKSMQTTNGVAPSGSPAFFHSSFLALEFLALMSCCQMFVLTWTLATLRYFVEQGQVQYTQAGLGNRLPQMGSFQCSSVPWDAAAAASIAGEIVPLCGSWVYVEFVVWKQGEKPLDRHIDFEIYTVDCRTGVQGHGGLQTGLDPELDTEN